ncbi:MutS-related protein [Marinilabilia salmonicolor]|uniref:MutS-related protein n=1 Tax=Marinilabilia salmonicolor TaxID=989 RepID=UPI00029AA20C|nr:DNA mismatch repair protein MutS [Marinilabilia salmonicolor]
MTNTTNDTPFQYYSARTKEYSAQLAKLARYFRFTAPARLLTFAGLIISALWFIKSKFDDTFIWLFLGFLVLFVLSVIWDLRLVRKQRTLKARFKVNENELKVLQHQFSEFDDGSDLTTTAPELSGDFDLFGAGSLFQYLNRCVTDQGRTLFAHELTKGERSSEEIRKRQESIAELSENPEFIEQFRALGLQTKLEKDEIRKLKEWLQSPPLKISVLKWAGRIWPFLFAVWITATALGHIAPNLIFIPIILPLFIVGRKSKTIQQAHNLLGRSAQTLKKYAGLIQLVESQSFSTKLLRSLQRQLTIKNKTASRILKELFKLLERFDFRLNLIMGPLLNILFLFDFHILVSLEKWKATHKDNVPGWFEAISKLDAMTGFAVFAFNNRNKTSFPEVVDTPFTYEAKDLKHPLLPDAECVGNDISFSGQPKILIITGANMAGKSTFLRTLTVNLILGMSGAPVCAGKMQFSPCNIRSSINIRDSLARHESYFYAELQRLKAIINHVKTQPNTFVVLDEILRGTNSLDKHNGSYGLLEKLISLNAIVVIATHDLGIGELEKQYPGTAHNYCFEVELEEDQLAFDYKLKPGVSQKLNASFLMKKMGLGLAK